LDRSGAPVAQIPPGGATTAADLMAAFGTATPPLPFVMSVLAEAARPADVQFPLSALIYYVVTS
jgi:hypothetical protein